MRAEETGLTSAALSAEAGGLVGTIHVILPVHERRAVTERFVRGLLKQTDTRYHLILLDDGSTDGTSEVVGDLLPSATVIRGDGTWWWAGCLDRARIWLADHAKAGDVVLIANDDTQFGPDFLAAGRAALARRPRSLVLAQLYDGDTGHLVEVGGRVDWQRLKFSGVLDPAAVNCLSTRGLFLRAADFISLGRFHRRLLPHYLSDFAFTIRASRRGYALASDPDLRLWYDPSTTGIRSVSASSARAYLRAIFSKRSTDNPVYMTSFLLLACPPRYLLRNLFRVWRRWWRGLRAAQRRPARP